MAQTMILVEEHLELFLTLPSFVFLKECIINFTFPIILANAESGIGISDLYSPTCVGNSPQLLLMIDHL